MKAIKLAAILAPLGEALLCVVFILFGRLSFTRSEDTNLVANAAIFFHLPGLFLGRKLFGPTLCGSTLLLAILLALLVALGSEHLIGVGMELAKGGENGPPTIRRVLPARPGAKAGVEPGWLLLSINGTHTTGRNLMNGSIRMSCSRRALIA